MIDRKIDDKFKKNVVFTKWWRSLIHRRKTESLAHVYRGLCNTYKARSPYMDSRSVSTYRKNRLRSRAYLEETFLQNEIGQTVSLATLADSTVSNPHIRRCEMMTQLRGFSEWAESQGDTATFVTLTTPSRMHRADVKGLRNPQYDGTHVRLAQGYLQTVWKRVRSKLCRDGIPVYGMRVAEPHHDGCPHWHLLVFVNPEHQTELKRVITHYALEDSPEEKGAEDHRVTFEDCDNEKGDPVAYMAKYVSKNIDGYGLETDDGGTQIADANESILAWSRIYGIRQFQFFGGPSRTVWRALRKIRHPFTGEKLESIRQTADQGDFKSYIQLMGGMNAPLSDRPVRCVEIPDNVDIDTGEIVGDVPSESLRIYLKYQDLLIPIQFHTWTKMSPLGMDWMGKESCLTPAGVGDIREPADPGRAARLGTCRCGKQGAISDPTHFRITQVVQRAFTS